MKMTDKDYRGITRMRQLRVLCYSICILGLSLILATLGSPGGLGIKGEQTVKVERDKNWQIMKYLTEESHGKTTWDWLGLIGVPTTIAVFGIWFQSEEQKRARQEAKEEILQRYIDRVSQLLLDKDLIGLASIPDKSNSVVESSSDVIRARTLSVLRAFSEDQYRKRSVIFFLIETGILKKLNVSLVNADLSYANLNGADLSKANLGGANLRYVDLSRGILNGTYLRHAELSNANLNNAILRRANLNFSDLRGTKLHEADLRGAKLAGTKLCGADLSRAILNEAYLGDADLRSAILRDAKLSSADLSCANLSGSDLSKANLADANLHDVDLRDAILQDADLRRTNLREAKLNECNFSGAIMSFIFLRWVVSSGARFGETIAHQ